MYVLSERRKKKGKGDKQEDGAMRVVSFAKRLGKREDGRRQEEKGRGKGRYSRLFSLSVERTCKQENQKRATRRRRSLNSSRRPCARCCPRRAKAKDCPSKIVCPLSSAFLSASFLSSLPHLIIPLSPLFLFRSPSSLSYRSDSSQTDFLEDLSRRVALSSTALPSICFYTLFNTHNSLTNVEISSDSSRAVGTFSDSSVRLWDLTKQATPLHDHRANNNSSSTVGSGGVGLGDEYKVMHGHSGPVYSASFSPDSLFVLTASEDKTGE